MHIIKTSLASLFCTATLAAPSMAAPMPGPCNGLSGYYGNVTAIVVGRDGKTVNVTMAGGRPNAYGMCTGRDLMVNFSDDKVIRGKFDGRTIFWENGTTWIKR